MAKRKQNAFKQKISKSGLRILDVAVALVTVILVGLGIWTLTHRNTSADAFECAEPGATHELSVQADTFSQPLLELDRCDIVIITNTGNESYRLASGDHDDLITYPGFRMQSVQPGSSVVLDARAAGRFTLHDHIRTRAQVVLVIRELDR